MQERSTHTHAKVIGLSKEGKTDRVTDKQSKREQVNEGGGGGRGGGGGT